MGPSFITHGPRRFELSFTRVKINPAKLNPGNSVLDSEYFACPHPCTGRNNAKLNSVEVNILIGGMHMADLCAHLNVYNTALVILEKKGWALRYDASQEWWFAKKSDWEFMADDPMQLLGLVAIYEHHSPKKKEEYWWKIDQPDLLSKLDPETR